jgi:hypothetical protein
VLAGSVIDACHRDGRAVVFVLAVDRPAWLTSFTGICPVAASYPATTDRGNGGYMPTLLDEILHRAKRCPLACALKILLFLLFVSALNIAVFFKNDMSIYAYVGFMAVIGYVAILAISTNVNCKLNLSEDD